MGAVQMEDGLDAELLAEEAAAEAEREPVQMWDEATIADARYHAMKDDGEI